MSAHEMRETLDGILGGQLRHDGIEKSPQDYLWLRIVSLNPAPLFRCVTSFDAPFRLIAVER